jgi:ribosomal protein S18 acetylase RimI-like enzyme
VQVRPARPEDAAAVAAVHVRTWQEAYEPVFGADRLAGMDVEVRRRRWERWLRDGERVWVAEADDRVVGFAWIGDSRDAEGEGELFAIYVLPEAWGGGAGPALMAAALGGLRERYRTATLWVLADNPRARRFYEREGWRLDGAEKRDEFLGVGVAEVRYRVGL